MERGGEGAQSPTEEKDVGHQARHPVVGVQEKNHTLRGAMCARTQSERAVRSRNRLDALHPLWLYRRTVMSRIIENCRSTFLMAENSSYRRYLRRVRRKEERSCTFRTAADKRGGSPSIGYKRKQRTGGGWRGRHRLPCTSSTSGPAQPQRIHIRAPLLLFIGRNTTKTEHIKRAVFGSLETEGGGASTCLLHPHEHDPVYDVEAYSNGEHRCRK